MRFHCAQRGCVSEGTVQPEVCPVCNNPWLGVIEDAPDEPAPDTQPSESEPQP